MENSLRDLPQVEMVTNHYYAHGTYTRELIIPAGTLLTGKIHRHSCVNILSKGVIRVVTDEGFYDLKAPATFISSPGVKKVGYALEDSVWINVHPWDGEQCLEELENSLIVESLEKLEHEEREKLCLG